jgi:hypothetical protein
VRPVRPALPVPRAAPLQGVAGGTMKAHHTVTPEARSRIHFSPRVARSSDFPREPRLHFTALVELACVGAALAVLASCSPPVEQPTGPAGDYARAKEDFAKGTVASYDRALHTLEGMDNVSKPNNYTDRARVLRAVILAAKVDADLRLTEAYAKGAAATKDSQLKEAFSQQREDTLQSAGEIALDFGQLAMTLTKGGALPKNLSLDAPFPSPPPPATVAAVEKIKEGLEVGQNDQLEAARDELRAAVAGILTDLVHGDNTSAASKLSAGPVPVSAQDFALFLTKELVAGASFFDKKHLDDPSRYKLMAGVAAGAAQAADAALKETPDPAEAKLLKQLQDQIKNGLKSM